MHFSHLIETLKSTISSLSFVKAPRPVCDHRPGHDTT
nr:MAG TPA: hypothetical protein [Caudoviricetes sp.]